jgi:hypothetical protein
VLGRRRGEDGLWGRWWRVVVGAEDAFRVESPLLVITHIWDRTLEFLPHAGLQSKGRWATRAAGTGRLVGVQGGHDGLEWL